MNEIIKKNGITFGIIAGLISVLTTVLIYVIDVNLFVSSWLGVISTLIAIVIGCLLMSKTKKEIVGIFSFKDAFTTYFIMAIIAVAIGIIFNIVLFNVIDPSLKETLKELILKKTISVMQSFGGNDPKVINEVIKKMNESDPYSPFEQIKGFVFALIFHCILGLILAAIFKFKNTEYNQ